MSESNLQLNQQQLIKSPIYNAGKLALAGATGLSAGYIAKSYSAGKQINKLKNELEDEHNISVHALKNLEKVHNTLAGEREATDSMKKHLIKRILSLKHDNAKLSDIVKHYRNNE